MNADGADRELDHRLSAAAGAIPRASVESGTLAQRVLVELRQRRVRRRARVAGLGALLLAGATLAWWAQAERHALRPTTPLAARPDSTQALAELAELRQQAELQQWLAASLAQSERCADYEQRLAGLPSIDDPGRTARLELERAAWLMLDDVERRAAAGASPAEQQAGYSLVSDTLSGTYWAKVADERRQQLTGETGT